MITKKQWKKFCWDLYDTKHIFGDKLSLHSRRVDSIDLNGYRVVTTCAGTPKTVYNFEQSISDHNRLKDLYSSVRFEGSLDQLYQMYRVMNEDSTDN